MNDIIKYETDLQTRTTNVIVRLTPDEKVLLLTEAKKLGISISAFIRLLMNTWVNNLSLTKKK
jgi:hypothetical protein